MYSYLDHFELITTKGDGHCLYYAVGHYLQLSPAVLRESVARHIEQNRQRYVQIDSEILNNGNFDQYLQELRKDQWGSEIEIIALQEIYQRPILILGDNKPPYFFIRPGSLLHYENPIFIHFNYYGLSKLGHYSGLQLNSNKSAAELCEQMLTNRSSEHFTPVSANVTVEDTTPAQVPEANPSHLNSSDPRNRSNNQPHIETRSDPFEIEGVVYRFHIDSLFYGPTEESVLRLWRAAEQIKLTYDGERLMAFAKAQARERKLVILAVESLPNNYLGLHTRSNVISHSVIQLNINAEELPAALAHELAHDMVYCSANAKPLNQATKFITDYKHEVMRLLEKSTTLTSEQNRLLYWFTSPTRYLKDLSKKSPSEQNRVFRNETCAFAIQVAVMDSAFAEKHFPKTLANVRQHAFMHPDHLMRIANSSRATLELTSTFSHGDALHTKVPTGTRPQKRPNSTRPLDPGSVTHLNTKFWLRQGPQVSKLESASLPAEGAHPLFENVKTDDLEKTLPPFKPLSVEDIRSTPNGEKPRCFKYVVLEDGSLVISAEWSEPILLEAQEAERLSHYYNEGTLRTTNVNGKSHEAFTTKVDHKDIVVIVDDKGKAIYKQVPLRHPEIAMNNPVLAAGDFYVLNGEIVSKHPSGRYGINNWTGHYLVNGEHLPSIVERSFKQAGFDEAPGKFWYRASLKEGGKTQLRPNIIRYSKPVNLPPPSSAMPATSPLTPSAGKDPVISYPRTRTPGSDTDPRLIRLLGPRAPEGWRSFQWMKRESVFTLAKTHRAFQEMFPARPMPTKIPFSFKPVLLNSVRRTLWLVDFALRVSEQNAKHPEAHPLVNATAAGASLTIDLAAFGAIAWQFGFPPALALSACCLLAETTRDLNPSDHRDNREMFLNAVFNTVDNESVQYQMIAAYDAGEPWTRDFVENYLRDLQVRAKPFIWLNNLGRAAVDFVRGTDEQPLESPATEQPGDTSEQTPFSLPEFSFSLRELATQAQESTDHRLEQQLAEHFSQLQQAKKEFKQAQEQADRERERQLTEYSFRLQQAQTERIAERAWHFLASFDRTAGSLEEIAPRWMTGHGLAIMEYFLAEAANLAIEKAHKGQCMKAADQALKRAQEHQKTIGLEAGISGAIAPLIHFDAGNTIGFSFNFGPGGITGLQFTIGISAVVIAGTILHSHYKNGFMPWNADNVRKFLKEFGDNYDQFWKCFEATQASIATRYKELSGLIANPEVSPYGIIELLNDIQRDIGNLDAMAYRIANAEDKYTPDKYTQDAKYSVAMARLRTQDLAIITKATAQDFADCTKKIGDITQKDKDYYEMYAEIYGEYTPKSEHPHVVHRWLNLCTLDAIGLALKARANNDNDGIIKIWEDWCHAVLQQPSALLFLEQTPLMELFLTVVQQACAESKSDSFDEQYKLLVDAFASGRIENAAFLLEYKLNQEIEAGKPGIAAELFSKMDPSKYPDSVRHLYELQGFLSGESQKLNRFFADAMDKPCTSAAELDTRIDELRKMAEEFEANLPENLSPDVRDKLIADYNADKLKIELALRKSFELQEFCSDEYQKLNRYAMDKPCTSAAEQDARIDELRKMAEEFEANLPEGLSPDVRDKLITRYNADKLKTELTMRRIANLLTRYAENMAAYTAALIGDAREEALQGIISAHQGAYEAWQALEVANSLDPKLATTSSVVTNAQIEVARGVEAIIQGLLPLSGYQKHLTTPLSLGTQGIVAYLSRLDEKRYPEELWRCVPGSANLLRQLLAYSDSSRPILLAPQEVLSLISNGYSAFENRPDKILSTLYAGGWWTAQMRPDEALFALGSNLKNSMGYVAVLVNIADSLYKLDQLVLRHGRIRSATSNKGIAFEQFTRSVQTLSARIATVQAPLLAGLYMVGLLKPGLNAQLREWAGEFIRNTPSYAVSFTKWALREGAKTKKGAALLAGGTLAAAGFAYFVLPTIRDYTLSAGSSLFGLPQRTATPVKSSLRPSSSTKLGLFRRSLLTLTPIELKGTLLNLFSHSLVILNPIEFTRVLRKVPSSTATTVTELAWSYTTEFLQSISNYWGFLKDNSHISARLQDLAILAELKEDQELSESHISLFTEVAAYLCALNFLTVTDFSAQLRLIALSTEFMRLAQLRETELAQAKFTIGKTETSLKNQVTTLIERYDLAEVSDEMLALNAIHTILGFYAVRLNNQENIQIPSHLMNEARRRLLNVATGRSTVATSNAEAFKLINSLSSLCLHFMQRELALVAAVEKKQKLNEAHITSLQNIAAYLAQSNSYSAIVDFSARLQWLELATTFIQLTKLRETELAQVKLTTGNTETTVAASRTPLTTRMATLIAGYDLEKISDEMLALSAASTILRFYAVRLDHQENIEIPSHLMNEAQRRLLNFATGCSTVATSNAEAFKLINSLSSLLLQFALIGITNLFYYMSFTYGLIRLMGKKYKGESIESLRKLFNKVLVNLKEHAKQQKESSHASEKDLAAFELDLVFFESIDRLVVRQDKESSCDSKRPSQNFLACFLEVFNRSDGLTAQLAINIVQSQLKEPIRDAALKFYCSKVSPYWEHLTDHRRLFFMQRELALVAAVETKQKLNESHITALRDIAAYLSESNSYSAIVDFSARLQWLELATTFIQLTKLREIELTTVTASRTSLTTRMATLIEAYKPEKISDDVLALHAVSTILRFYAVRLNNQENIQIPIDLMKEARRRLLNFAVSSSAATANKDVFKLINGLASLLLQFALIRTTDPLYYLSFTYCLIRLMENKFGEKSVEPLRTIFESVLVDLKKHIEQQRKTAHASKHSLAAFELSLAFFETINHSKPAPLLFLSRFRALYDALPENQRRQLSYDDYVLKQVEVEFLMLLKPILYWIKLTDLQADPNIKLYLEIILSSAVDALYAVDELYRDESEDDDHHNFLEHMHKILDGALNTLKRTDKSHEQARQAHSAAKAGMFANAAPKAAKNSEEKPADKFTADESAENKFPKNRAA